MRDYFLKRIDGGKEYQTFKLPSDAEQVTIGRAQNSTHVILSQAISRKHAALQVQLDKWYISDTDSMNGVTVNTTLLTPRNWYHIDVGDKIHFTPSESNEKFIYEVCVDNDEISENELLRKVREMEKLLVEKDQVQKELEAKLGQKDAEINRKLEEDRRVQKAKYESELEEHRKVQKAKYESELELELNRKEEALLETLQQQTRRIERDMEDVQKELRLDYAKQLSEHNKELQEKLEKEKSRLNIELKQANSKMSVLKKQIEVAKATSNLCSETAAIAERQKVVQLVTNVMDNEFQCSICNELFIKAVTLNCSHTYCVYCISIWEKTNKICPICRAAITTKTNSIVLDSFIEAICDNISDELKAKRNNLVMSRAAEMEATKKVRKPPKKRRRSTRAANQLDAPSTSGTSTRARAVNRAPVANQANIPMNHVFLVDRPPLNPTFPMSIIPDFNNLFQTAASYLGISNSTAATTTSTSDAQSSSVTYISSDSDTSPNPRRRNRNRRSRGVIVVSDTEDCE